MGCRGGEREGESECWKGGRGEEGLSMKERERERERGGGGGGELESRA